jgi:ATP-binding cassette subfamily B protein
VADKRVMKRVLGIGRAFELIWQSSKGWALANAGLVLIQGLLPLVSIYLLKMIVDAVAAGAAAPDKQIAVRHVMSLVLLAGLVGLLASACQSLAGLARESQSQAVADHMFDVLHTKSAGVDLEYYENPRYRDTLHLAQREAPWRPTSMVNSLTQIAQSGIALLGIVGLLVGFHWVLATILFVAALPAVLVRLKYARKRFDWQRKATPAERQAWYLNWVLTGDEHAKEVRLFDLGPLFVARFRLLRDQLRKEKLAIARQRFVAEEVTEVSSAVAVYGSLAYVAYRTAVGAISLGDLVLFYQVFQRGQAFLMDMFRGMATLYEDSLFLSSFHEFLGIRNRVLEPASPQPVPRPIRRGIVFDHVSFQYPGSARKVLDDICLDIRAGEVVALVGENGAGKTTLVKLLCRLYDPTDGGIALDGVDLRQLRTTELRRHIGAILQDYARYNLTARENIWLGNTVLAPDDESVLVAARRSGADTVISGLARGYETTLGRQFEDGEELSAGQWQAIALARAFVREAQLVILDEPTSSLDARTEYEVFTKFRGLIRGRTAVLISHRFSTVRMADRIYVLKDGRVAESGTHDELIRLGGTYAKSFETQAQYYR